MGIGSSSTDNVISNVAIPNKNSPYPKQSYSSPDNNNSQSAINHYNPGANLKDMDHQAILQNDNPNQVVVSEEHLEAYVALEKEIHNMEKNKILQQLHCSVNELQLLIAEITELEATKQKLDTDIMSKNLGGQPEPIVKELIKEIDEIDRPKSKSNKGQQQEQKPEKDPNSLEAQRDKIVAELKGKRMKRDKLEKHIAGLNDQAAELLDKYLKQDELLVYIFGNAYGSEEEARLEEQLNILENKKERLEIARKKWKEAQLLLEYACKQLAVAVKLWQNLSKIPTINLEVRYSMTNDPHEQQPALGHNEQLERQYGQMPHCTPQELVALEEMAASSAPGTVDEHHLLALDNCSESYKKAIYLLKWFNKVLNTTIHRDLVDASEEVRVTSQALRKERIKLLKEKIKVKYGKSFDLDDCMSDEAIKHMLSGCNGTGCTVDHSKFQNAPEINVTSENQKQPPIKIQITNGLQHENRIEIQKFHHGLQINRARMEQQLGQQLSARRGLRAARSASPSPDKTESH